MNQKRPRIYYRLVAASFAAALTVAPAIASAACTGPSGNAGDIAFSSSSGVMAYCNGASWISMGQAPGGGTTFGSFTTGDFCTATSGTTIACTTAQINLATQTTGSLGVAQGGTGLASITTNGIIYGQGTSAPIVTSAGSQYNVFVAGASGVPGFGQVALNQSAAVTGNLGVANGGTGTATAFTAGSIVFAGGSGVYSQDNANFFYDATNHRLGLGNAAPGATLSVTGTEALTFGTDYSTTGAQQDAPLNTASSFRYTGSGTATFYGIVAGTAGQILNLHNASASTLTVSNQSSSETTVANRIITGSGSDLAMAANSSITMQYDGIASRWRVIGGSSSGGALANLSDVTLTSPASGNLLTYNGSKWVNSTVASAVAASVAPAFSVTRNNVVQSVSSGVDTKIQFTTKLFDTNNNFDNTTNYRYTPTVAGKYFFSVQTYCSSSCYAEIWKNGAVQVESYSGVYGTANAILDMNGTTDYVEGYVNNNGGTSVGGAAGLPRMDGALIAPLMGSGSAAGTTGQVQFNNGGSTLGASANFFWDNTNARLGIGTNAPATALQVNGAEALTLNGTDLTTTGSSSDIAPGTFSSIRYNGASAATWYGIVAGTSGQILFVHNVSPSTLTLSNQSSSEATLANRIITGTGVDMAMAPNSSITMQYDGTASRWRVIGGSTTPAGTTGQVQYNSGSNTFAASTGLTYDATNTRLGIGTATPSSTLHVYGGEVQVGSSGATCNSTTAGAVRYSGGLLMFCDSSGWKALPSCTGTRGSDTSLATSIAAYWKFDENTGTTLADSTNNGYTGTFNGTAGSQWGTGKLGSDLVFNGTNNYVSTTYVQNAVTAYTISAWVKTTSNYVPIVTDRGSGIGVTLTIGHDVNGKASCGADGSGIYIGAYNNTLVNDGNWHHLVCVFSAASGTSIANSSFTVYVDGVAGNVSSSVAGSATSPLSGSGGTAIGYHASWGIYMNGSIDEVGIWTTALNSTQVSTLYNSGSGNVFNALSCPSAGFAN